MSEHPSVTIFFKNYEFYNFPNFVNISEKWLPYFVIGTHNDFW